ncbi:TPR-like protein [Mycena galericulata]|nr:TPR-like protein [Mycena galericulata]
MLMAIRMFQLAVLRRPCCSVQQRFIGAGFPYQLLIVREFRLLNFTMSLGNLNAEDQGRYPRPLQNELSSIRMADQDTPISFEEEDGGSDIEWSSDSEEATSSDESIHGEENPDIELDPDAQARIEDDFQRLVDDIRSDARGSGAFLTKDWDFNPVEDAADGAQFKDELRRATGVGKARRKKAESLCIIPLSHEVKYLIGAGNQAYVDGNNTEAIRIMLEVIRIEPRVVSAWLVLAQCYEDMKEEKEALKLRIMAAHLTHDAEEWDRLARQSRELGYKQQAIYCWGKMVTLEPRSVSAQWDRASLAREVGDLKTARVAFLAILEQYPHDITVLLEIRPILVEIPDLPTCTALFEGAFDYYRKFYPSGFVHDPTTDRVVPGGGFGHLEILVLADLYNTAGNHGRAIDTIRQGVRWLQGRGEHRYWDVCDDDREFDEAGFDRCTTSGLRPGMFPLDTNSRHRLAIARIKLGDAEEAKVHVKAILCEDILDYAPLFLELADTYFEDEMYAEAQPLYISLSTEASTCDAYVLFQTAACYRMLGGLQEAAKLYEQVRLLDPTHNEAKMRLAEIYETTNQPRKALQLVLEAIHFSRLRGHSDASVKQAPSASLFVENGPAPKNNISAKNGTPPRISSQELEAIEAAIENETLNDFKIVKEIWPRISVEKADESEAEWLFHAQKMIENFCKTKQLFSTADSYRGMFPPRNLAHRKGREEDEDRMASRLQLELGCGVTDKAATSTDVFRGLNFAEWLRIIFQYTFILSKRGDWETAHGILEHICCALPYRSSQRQDSIRIAIATCAVASKHFSAAVDQFKKLMLVYQFNNEPLRIFLAALADGGTRATDAFRQYAFQKVVGREMKFSRIASESPKMIRWCSLNKRFTTSTPRTGDAYEVEVGVNGKVTQGPHSIPDTTHRSTTTLTVLYAQMCILGRSYRTAISYLLRAYVSSPDDPLLCLSLAIASLGRAMQQQRQSYKHPQLIPQVSANIAQGMAFLTHYRRLRLEPLGGIGEVEFNFGRAFHELGLYSHAVTHYEKVLQLGSVEGTNSKEAAYNLAQIYAMTGANPLAESIYRRWLSL